MTSFIGRSRRGEPTHPYGSVSRKRRRVIDYDPHQWRDHLLDVKGSVLRKVGPRVLLACFWAALVGWVDHHFKSLDIPSIGHSLVGVALGLLLVFRTNASYDR